MFDLSFKINGRTIPANRVAEELKKNIKKATTSMATRHVESIRCPVHGRAARLHPTGFNGQFRVEGCCDKLISEVQRHLQ